MLQAIKTSALARPLAHGRYRALWLATLVSNMGGMMQTVAAAWLMATLTGSAHMVALVQSASTLPVMGLSLAAGAFADHFDRRHIMLVAQGLMFFASGLLAYLTWSGHIAPWSLLLLTLLVGMGIAIHAPAWQSSIRQHVPMEDLPEAISLNSIGYNVARTMGPALGGALMLVAGPAANFSVNCITYVALILVLLQWRASTAPSPAPQKISDQAMTVPSLLRAMRDGLVYVWQARTIRFAFLRNSIFAFAGAAIWALMPLIARDVLAGSQLSYGGLLGAMGVGSIVGALLMTTARHRLNLQQILAGSALAYGVASIGSISGVGLIWVMGLMLLAGIGWVLTLATVNVAIQIESTQAFLARAIAINNMGVFGGLALGSYMWGMMADLIGLRATILASGIAVIATMALAAIMPLPQHAGRARPQA